jgi:hypothetical protein
MRDIDETISKWAFLTALKKAADEELKLLRPEVDEHFIQCYEDTHGKQYEVRMDGEDVGTFTVKLGKGTPMREVTVPECTDFDELWMSRHGKEWEEYVEQRTNDWLHDNYEQLAIDWFDETGELLDGMSMVTHREPERPAGVVGTMARIDPLKVSGAMARNGLPVSLRGLLEGGGR